MALGRYGATLGVATVIRPDDLSAKGTVRPAQITRIHAARPGTDTLVASAAAPGELHRALQAAGIPTDPHLMEAARSAGTGLTHLKTES